MPRLCFLPTRAGGVSLKLHGMTIPNNSLVDFDDILYQRTARAPDPNNTNGLHDQVLLCETDLQDCCAHPRSVHGNWYYPNGEVVRFDTDGRNLAFRSNRGANERINGQQFYGSVRLFRRFGPKERGHFRCELPNAGNPSVNQTLYANIGEFVCTLCYLDIIYIVSSEFWA